MKSWIRHHGNVELVCRSEAERYGWTAKIDDVDVDPLEEGIFGIKPDIGRGTVLVSNGDITVTFEYRLPELENNLRGTVKQLVRADDREKGRRERPEGPIEI